MVDKNSFGFGQNLMVCTVELGVDLEVFDISSIDEGDFYVKFHLRNRADGFQWVLIAIYGSADQNIRTLSLQSWSKQVRRKHTQFL